MENRVNGFIDANESKIGDNERVYFSAPYSSKEKAIGNISVLITAGLVIGLLLGKFVDEVPMVLTFTFVTIVCAVIFGIYKATPQRGGAVVTEKKLLAYTTMTFWFTYDEVFSCKVRRGPLDLVFGTGKVVVRVMHTWSNSQTGQIIRQAPGTIAIRNLKNPHEFAAALNRAKAEHTEAQMNKKV